MTTLYELLTQDERFEITQRANYHVSTFDLETNVIDLTVNQLRIISLTIIGSEYNGKIPACVLSAEAINILVRRAIERGKDLF